MLTAPPRSRPEAVRNRAVLRLSLEVLAARNDEEVIAELFGDPELFEDHLEQLRFLCLVEAQ